MNDGPRSQRARRVLMTGATAGFAGELEALMRDRCRLVFFLGLVISVVLIGIARLLLTSPPIVPSFYEEWEWALDLGHILSFAIGLGLLYVGRPGPIRLQRTAFVVIAFNIVLVMVNGGVVSPDYPPALAISLGLFVPAAVLPWRTRYQVWLGMTALVAVFGVHVAWYLWAGEIQEYWATNGGTAAFWNQLLGIEVGILILAAAAVVVTRTLYVLRKTAHEAQRFGSYLVEREIGRGGMGKVFKAEHAMLCRPAAVKVLRESTGVAHALDRFEREVHLSSGLSHPNTITIFDFGHTADNSFYYAMEYLEGMNLEELVERFGPVDAARAIHLLLQVCGSLKEAHGRGIIHRDLKPSNIYLTERGGIHDFVKVLDFGIAKQVSAPADRTTPLEDGVLTEVGTVVGTPRYMAPEAYMTDRDLDPRSDIYSLGAVAYWLLTGQPPFTDPEPVVLLKKLLTTEPRKPSELTEVPVPAALDEVVVRCLRSSAGDRYQAVEELELALRAVNITEPWSADRARRWWELHVTCEQTARS